MWTPPDSARSQRSAKSRRLRATLSTLALTGLLLCTGLPAAESRTRLTPADDKAALSPERTQLRQTILGLYEVLPMRGGLLLKPHASKVGVKTIELTDGTIAINGEATPPSVVRAWLVGDAPPLLELSELAPAERRQLFGLPVEGSAAAAPKAAAAPPPAPSGTTAENVKPSASDKDDSDDKSEETEKAGDSTAPTPPEAPEAPEPPSPPSTAVSAGPRVRVGGSQRVEANEVADSVVAVGGAVHVDGEVERDVASIGGSSWINGKVGGGVTAVGGSVHLGPKAEVEGDVTSVLGHILAEPGATVHGAKTEVSPGDIVLGGKHGDRFEWSNPYRDGFSGAASFFWTVLWLLLKVLLVSLTLLLARPRIERLERRLAAEPWESGGVGLLSLVAFAPALVIATLLTCCLFLILYPVVFVIVVFVWALGYTTAVYRIGLWAEGRFGWGRDGNPYVAALVGMVLIESLRLVGALFRIDSGVFNVVGALIGGSGRVIVFCATIAGIGVVLLDRFAQGWRRTPPTPPNTIVLGPDDPVPPEPPIPAPRPAPPREPWEGQP